MNSNSLNKIQNRPPFEAKFRKVLSLVSILFLTTITLQAQEKENLGTEVVNIVKPYSPTISDAFKVKEVPVYVEVPKKEKKRKKKIIRKPAFKKEKE